MVFVGFGIVEPRLQYDDYLGQDVSGKIVLMLEREPGVDDPASPFDGIVTTETSRSWRKTLAAQERGAAGVLFVRDVHNRMDIAQWDRAHINSWPASPRRIERFTLATWVEQIQIPAAQISLEPAEALVWATGSDFTELSAASESDSGLE